MPANFPEIWLSRVIQNLEDSDQATFLEGIPELDTPIVVINEGDITEKNKIYVAATDFEVDILINNNSYPIPFQEYTDGTIEITLDKYQTKVVTLRDDDTLGASYPKIDAVTRSCTHGIDTTKYQRAIHSIAPLTDTTDTPVLVATGGKDNLTDPTGRPILVYEDLVEAKRRCKYFGESRLVLNHNHWNDLLLDRKNFGNQLVDYAKGKPNPVIAGFEIHKYDGKMPLFAADKTKKPYGSIQGATDLEASVIFNKYGIAKKTGQTKQYFTPALINTTRQSNDLAYRHYYVVMPFRAKKIGAII